MLPYILWITLCSWLVCTGWVLSSLHELNAGGYMLSLLLFVMLVTWWVRVSITRERWITRGLVVRLRRRFCRPLPLIYLLLLALISMGDVLYAPTQYDALCYRLPRMLHWVSEGHWHWIHSFDNRLNLSAVNYEWMTMPLLALTRSDRWLWIPNLVSFALLPGLIFGMFRRLGMAPRAAWSWMWLLPSGFCFVTQAGSIGNDLTAVPFALASVYFALRARRGCYRDLALAILSTAMITGIKASNIPLVLPALLAALPTLYLLPRKPWTSLAVLLVAVMLSFLPMAFLNQLHAGHWTGDRENAGGMRITSPSAGLLGNGIMVTLASFQPPVLPQRGLTIGLVTHFLGEKRIEALKEAFPRFDPGLEELPVEEGSGLGLGVTFVLVAGILLQFRLPRDAHSGTFSLNIVLLAGVVALGGFMIKMGSESAARLLMPYYPIVLAGVWMILVRRQNVVRLPAWRWGACVGALVAIPVLVLSPARPLWPALTFLKQLNATYRSSQPVSRALKVYETYRRRPQALAPVREALPVDARVVALASGGGDLETSLWWPLGSRELVHLFPRDGEEFLRQHGTKAICVSQRTLGCIWHTTPEEFAARFKGRIIATPEAIQVISWGEETWYVIQIN